MTALYRFLGRVHNTILRVVGRKVLRADTDVLLLATVVGVLAGYGAIGFRYLIAYVRQLSLGSADPGVVGVLTALPWYWKLVIPAIGGAIVGPMVCFLAREAQGSGVPEVMEAIAIRGGRIRRRLLAIKTLASAITIGTGGSVGREGPVVQIGATIGSLLGRLTGIFGERMRVLVACGGSAAIAAAFNAPIAGVLFSVEVLLGNYGITTLSPIIIASVVATVVSRMHLGDTPAFEIPTYSLGSAPEVLVFAVLGVAAGVVGFLFIQAMRASGDLFERLPIPDYTRAAAGGLLLGVGIIFLPQLYGVGYGTIEAILKMGSKGDAASLAWHLLLVLVVAKILATSVTIGSGGSGGVFAPSLLIGAALGAVVGLAMGELFPGHIAPPGAYAVAGMGAVVGATTRAPITAILMIFEMTGDYKFILPIMVSCIIASLVTSKLSRLTIYSIKLARRGVDLEQGMEVSIMRGTRVRDLVRHDVSTFLRGAPFTTVIKRTLESRQMNHYVVDTEHRLAGTISFHDVKSLMHEMEMAPAVVADDMAQRKVPFVDDDDPLSKAMELLVAHNLEEIPVVDETRLLLGSISKQSIMDLYSREVLKAGPQGMKFVRRQGGGTSLDYFRMDDGSGVEVVTVAGSLVGKSLAELNLRKHHGVNVVSIRSPERSTYAAVPDPTIPLREGDVLVLAGGSEEMARLREELE